MCKWALLLRERAHYTDTKLQMKLRIVILAGVLLAFTGCGGKWSRCKEVKPGDLRIAGTWGLESHWGMRVNFPDKDDHSVSDTIWTSFAGSVLTTIDRFGSKSEEYFAHLIFGDYNQFQTASTTKPYNPHEWKHWWACEAENGKSINVVLYKFGGPPERSGVIFPEEGRMQISSDTAGHFHPGVLRGSEYEYYGEWEYKKID